MKDEQQADFLKDLHNWNPYPADVFTEPSEEEYKKAWTVLREAGISADRIAAKWGRTVWNNCIDTAN